MVEVAVKICYTTIFSKIDKQVYHQLEVLNKDILFHLEVHNNYKLTLVNFYSFVGINFQNIASNDAMITSMLNKYSKEAWELINIVSSVESDAGKGDGYSIFITRYYFRKKAANQ